MDRDLSGRRPSPFETMKRCGLQSPALGHPPFSLVTDRCTENPQPQGGEMICNILRFQESLLNFGVGEKILQHPFFFFEYLNI